MKSITVEEYKKKREEGVEPSAADLAIAETEEFKKRITLRWLRGNVVEVKTNSHVGVVDLDCVSIRVMPKLLPSELDVLAMLDYAAGLESLRELALRRRIPTGLNLRDLVCLLLTRECDRLVRYGLRRDYLRREEALPVVRGRLLVERQVTRRFGMLDRLECRYDERSGDILDNRLCGAALHVAARTARDAGVRAHARRLAADFAGVCSVTGFDARAAVERLSYDRANEHYRDAHRWARMLLEGSAFTERRGTTPSTTHAFMVDMNRLFEDFVTRLLRDAFRGTGVTVRAQETLPRAIRSEGGGAYAPIRPDVQLVHANRRWSVDAKYKLYATDERLATSDLFQGFAYAQAVSSGAAPTAFVLYAADRDMPVRTAALHRQDGEVAARVMDVAVDVPGILKAIAARETPPLFARLRELVF